MNTYVFDSGTQKKLFISFGIGVLLLLLGVLFHGSGNSGSGEHGSAVKTEMAKAEAPAAEAKEAAAEGGEEFKEAPLGITVIANVYNVFYFGFYIALAALFFLAGATVAWGGWQIQIQKVPLAMAMNIILFLGLLLFMFLFFRHDLFLWTNEHLYDPKDPMYDKVLFYKHDFLNMNAFWSFFVIIAGICISLAVYWWKFLTGMDTNPSRKLFSKSRLVGAITIVTTAFIINTFATWYWSMSIQPHWYSTMFTWNTMAGAAVAMLSIILVIVYFLKGKGYLPNVNENHQHDIAKLMFAISIFWTYTWFAQYMLIWYANLPEETEYFRLRRNFDNYGILFHLSFICNFVLPFLILMTRGSKRSKNISMVAAAIIIFGQFCWFFLMNCPALLPKDGFGLISLGCLLMGGSVFTFVTLKVLSGVKDLESSTHPYVKESYQFKI